MQYDAFVSGSIGNALWTKTRGTSAAIADYESVSRPE